MKQLSFLAVIALGASLTSCNPDPSVSFTPSATSVMTDEVISFTNSSVDAYDYRWDFGDGGYSEVENPTYSYGTPGTYTVTLQATDKKSKELYTSVATIEVTIDEHAQWEIDRKAERDAMIDLLVGKWTKTYSVTYSDGTTFDPEVTNIEIFEEGTYVETDSDGELSASSWSYISDDYILFDGRAWKLEEAKSSGFTMTYSYDIALFVTVTVTETITLD